MGLIWLAIAVYVGSLLLLWPVAALVGGGALLTFRPGERLTWAWAVSAAVLGLILALYQTYVAAPLVAGAFATLAGASVVVFGILSIGHLVLVYFGATLTGKNPK